MNYILIILVVITSSRADVCSDPFHNVRLFLNCVKPRLMELVKSYTDMGAKSALVPFQSIDCSSHYEKAKTCVSESRGFCAKQSEIPELIMEFIDEICLAMKEKSAPNIAMAINKLLEESRMFDTIGSARECYKEAKLRDIKFLECVANFELCSQRVIDKYYVCTVSSWHGQPWAEETKAELDFFLKEVNIFVSPDPFCKSDLTLPKVMCKFHEEI